LSNANSLVILDFETTGLSPDQGDRAIEIGAVRLVNGDVTEEFQQLMNPSRRVSSFIEEYTGISNHMLKDAAPCADVMSSFVDFIGDDNLIAHNASFDKRFLDAELSQISSSYSGSFSCSLLLARRIFQTAPSYSLGNLIKFLGIKTSGSYHRALFDAQVTAKLWLVLIDEIQQKTQLDNVPFTLIKKIIKTPKKSVPALLAKY